MTTGSYGPTTSYTQNPGGTITPNISPGALAGSFNPASMAMGGNNYSTPQLQGPGYGTATSDQANQLNALLGLYQPQIDLANQLGTNQIGDLYGQQFWNNQSIQNQINSQNQSAMYQMQGFGLDAQSLGIQQGALARQLGMLPQQYGIQQQQFGLQGQQIDLSQKQAWEAAAQQQRGLASQLTASGNPYSVGGAQQRQDIATQLQNQMTGFGINRQQLGLQQQSAAQNYFEQTAAMQDSQKQLSIQSQRLGISESELKSRLDNALNQLGIQGQISSDQVLSEIGKVQQGMVSPIAGMLGFIGQYANTPGLLGGGQ